MPEASEARRAFRSQISGPRLRSSRNVLNIAWVKDALEHPARIICPRSNRCPRPERCEGAKPSRAREITDVRAEVMATATDEELKAAVRLLDEEAVRAAARAGGSRRSGCRPAAS